MATSSAAGPPQGSGARRGSTPSPASANWYPALAVALGLALCALAVMIMFHLGPFAESAATPKPVALGTPITVDSQVTVHGRAVSTRTRLVLYAAKTYAAKGKTKKPVNVSLEIVNGSTVPISIVGARQSLKASDGSITVAQTAKLVIPAHATRKIVFTFLMPPKPAPRDVTIEIANKKTTFALR
jgi:hypothetical protein